MRLQEEKQQKKYFDGSSKEDRVTNWYNYFTEFFSKQPKITNKKESIATILVQTEMNIQIGPFNNDEYENVREHIKDLVLGTGHLVLVALLLKY